MNIQYPTRNVQCPNGVRPGKAFGVRVRLPEIPPEVHACCAALGMVPRFLLDWDLYCLGFMCVSLEGLERHFRPGENESLREAIVRQRGEAAAVSLLNLGDFLKDYRP